MGTGFLAYLGRRLLRLVLSLVAVSLITFALLQLAPGNFADIQRISSGASTIGSAGTEAVASAFESRYGADVPVWKQYLIFMKGAVTWDFGPSYKYPTLDVQDIIAKAFPVSATLALWGTGADKSKVKRPKRRSGRSSGDRRAVML